MINLQTDLIPCCLCSLSLPVPWLALSLVVGSFPSILSRPGLALLCFVDCEEGYSPVLNILPLFSGLKGVD